MNNAELRSLLSHPDAQIRSWADWALEARGAGWRNPGSSFPNAAAAYVRDITDRLVALDSRP